MDLVQAELDRLSPKGFACTFLPDTFSDDIDSGVAFARVQRMGGGLDEHRNTDLGMLQVDVIAASRSAAWQVMTLLRTRFLAFYQGGEILREDGSKTYVYEIEEINGPLQLPELNPDDRMVRQTVVMRTRRNTR